MCSQQQYERISDVTYQTEQSPSVNTKPTSQLKVSVAYVIANKNNKDAMNFFKLIPVKNLKSSRIRVYAPTASVQHNIRERRVHQAVPSDVVANITTL